jgi:hypothetical protein
MELGIEEFIVTLDDISLFNLIDVASKSIIKSNFDTIYGYCNSTPGR